MRYIVAESARRASATAAFEGWQRVGQLEWVDKDNERVRYAPWTRDLCGEPGAVVYLGYGWFKNKEFEGLRELSKTLDLTMMPAG